MQSLIDFSSVPLTANEGKKPPTEGGGSLIDFSSVPMAGGGTDAPATSYRRARDRGGFTDEDWEVYRRAISKKESGSEDGTYNISGGAGGHYDGRFQMGTLAKLDAGDELGEAVADRDTFRNDADMQDRFFDAYTAKNYDYMMENEKFRNLDAQGKLEVLAYAHNQGHSKAKQWLDKGVVSVDGFGTAGTAFSELVRSGFEARATEAGAMPFGEDPETWVPPDERVPPLNERLTPATTDSRVKGSIAPEEVDSYLQSTIANAPGSAKKFFSDMAAPFLDPVGTAKAIKLLGEGALSKAGVIDPSLEGEAALAAVGQFYVDRYGSLEAAKETFRKDPVGFVSDLSVLFTAGGSLAVKGAQVAGKTAKTVQGAGRAAGVPGVAAAGNVLQMGAQQVERAGKAAKLVGDATDPLTLPVRGAAMAGKATGEGAALIGGLITGQDALPIQLAAKAGFAAGSGAGKGTKQSGWARYSSFNRGKKASADAQTEVVEDLGIALNLMRARRNAAYQKGKGNWGLTKKVGARVVTAISRKVDNIVNDIAFQVGRTSGIKAPLLDKNGMKWLNEGLLPTIQGWRQRALVDAPQDFRTLEGLDALKKSINNQFQFVDKNSREWLILNKVHDAVSEQITKISPRYADDMKRYDEASRIIRQMEQELKLKNDANIGTSLRALNQVMRKNANANFDHRAAMVQLLQEQGAFNVMEKMAGVALSQKTPIGLARAVTGTVALGGAGGGLLSTLSGLFSWPVAISFVSGLILTSPRVWGELASKGGVAAGAASRVPLRGTLKTSRAVGQTTGAVKEPPKDESRLGAPRGFRP